MHGFGAVADRRRAEAHVLQETHDALAVFGGNALPRREKLLADFADGLPVAPDNRAGIEVLLRRHGDHEPARDVFGKAHDFIREARHVLLAVRQFSGR